MYAKYVELRDARELSDYAVAAATGINASTFSDWKSGRSKPKLEKLVKLSEFFEVPITVFIEKEDS